MSTWIVEHGMVPLLVPEVFPPVDFSMQAHVFFGDTWHHPYISTCFCGKRFYFPLYICMHVCVYWCLKAEGQPLEYSQLGNSQYSPHCSLHCTMLGLPSPVTELSHQPVMGGRGGEGRGRKEVEERRGEGRGGREK